jgi:2-dehydropantoate 2-reductase
MRIAIVGAGAMGSVYAGLLGDAGNDVWAIDPWAEHVAAIREHGLRVEGASGNRVVRLAATSDPSEVGEVDLVVIATKAMQVRAAAENAHALLGPETMVLTMQNGLGSPEVAAEVLGDERIVVGIAGGFGASVVEPGHVHHHGMELVRLGEPHVAVSPRVERIADVWRDAGFTVQAEDDVARLVWEKLICNVCFSGTCTVLERTIGEVLDDTHAWSIASACAVEAYKVAVASGVALCFADPVEHSACCRTGARSAGEHDDHRAREGRRAASLKKSLTMRTASSGHSMRSACPMSGNSCVVMFGFIAAICRAPRPDGASSGGQRMS